MLDASEYLHLAIHASKENNHHAALGYLNEAIKHEPNNAGVVYFLGAEHAELGLFERAFTEIKRAVALDPAMDIAWFQLGLLSLQLQRPDEARSAFDTLHSRGSDPSLCLFASAYLDLLGEHVANAVAKIEKGLEQCDNPALANDMRRVLASLSNTDASPPAGSDEAGTVYLGAYRNSVETP